MAELYLMNFSSGRAYIGITSRNAAYRYKKHANAAMRGSSLLVHKAWRKHGNPIIKTLVIGAVEYLLEIETKAIAVFGTLMPDGYNMALGGQTAPSVNPEIAKKISISKRGKPVHPNTRAACIAKNTGFKHSNETKAKLSSMRMGHAISEETRRKISEAQKGKPRNPESIAKMAESQRGKKQSQETKEKRAIKMRGRRWPAASYARGWETRRRNAAEKGE